MRGSGQDRSDSPADSAAAAAGIGQWPTVAKAGDLPAGPVVPLPLRDLDGRIVAIDFVARDPAHPDRACKWRAATDGAMPAELESHPGAAALQHRLNGLPAAPYRSGPPRVMGIVNATPDSFSDGGLAAKADDAIARARQLATDGAGIIDVGGESTRPGAQTVPAEEEWRRVAPVLEALVGDGITVSIDTRKALVMQRAAALGVPIINDVSALTYDPAAMAAAAQSSADIVLMHAQGDPATMQQAPRYDDVVLDVFDALETRIAACVAAGIDRSRLIADPGIGFGKTFAQNVALLRCLPMFQALGVPLLVGASRKGFIGWLTGVQTARDRLGGSVGAALFAADRGADILRVHDVAATAEALAVFGAAAGWRARQDAAHDGQPARHSG